MRTKLGIAAFVAVVLAVAGVSLASAQPTGSSSTARADAVITVVETTDQFAGIDLLEPGLTLGDQFVFSGVLSEQEGGPTIGHSGVHCTVVRIDDHGIPTDQCVATASLHGGQITVQGLLTFDQAPGTGRFVLAITGGTGAFKNARGQLLVQEVTPDVAILTFELTG